MLGFISIIHNHSRIDRQDMEGEGRLTSSANLQNQVETYWEQNMMAPRKMMTGK